MKRLMVLLLLVSLTLISIGYTNSKASSFVKITDKENYVLEDNDLYIIGNFAVISAEDKEIIDQKMEEGKYVLIYDFNYRNTSFDEDLFDEEIIATAYYFEDGFRARKTLTTNKTNYGQIKKDISLFFEDFVTNDDYKKDTKKAIVNLPSNTEEFFLSTSTPISLSTDPTCNFVKTEVESGEKEHIPYGKIYYKTNVYRCDVDPEFDVFMVDTQAEFIPGHAMKNLGYSEYDEWNSEEAWQKTKIYQYSTYYYGYPSYGEEPNILEYWPKNNPNNVTISTSFGIGATLGVSQTDGFKGELTANFGYSQSYTTTDPSMSASTLIPGERYGWYFNFINQRFRETFHFQSGQMVEMENGNHNGTFRLQHDFYFQVDKWYTLPREITFTPSRTVFGYN